MDFLKVSFILMFLNQSPLIFCQTTQPAAETTGITTPSTLTNLTGSPENATLINEVTSATTIATNVTNNNTTILPPAATTEDTTNPPEVASNITATTTTTTTILGQSNTTTTSTTTATPTTTTGVVTTTLQTPINRLYLAVRFASIFIFLPSSSRIYSLEPDNFDGELNLNDGNKIAVNGQTSSQFWAMATDYHRQLVYYTDYYANFIGVYNVKTHEHKSVFQGLSYGIDGVSVDWYTGNVYWVDTSQHWVMVAENTFTYYINIANVTSKVPARIAVDSVARKVFWSEVGDTECRLMQCDMGGNNIKTIHVFTDISSIDALSLDVNDGRLYWTERLRSTATTSTTDSRVRYFALDSPETVNTVYLSESSVYVSMTTYKNYIYVCDKLQQSVFVLNKTSSSRIYQFSLSRNQHPRSVVIYSEYLQPLNKEQSNDPCVSHSCQEICIPGDGDSFTCACSFGSYLSNDGNSCKTDIFEDNFALLIDSAHEKIYQILLSNPSEYTSLPIPNIGHVEAIDYDPITKTVYWLDSKADIIYKSLLNGSNQEAFAYNVHAVSFAIDHSSRNLYYANTVIDSIVVTSLELRNVTSTLQVHNIYTVLEIYVSSRLGKVFWSDWGQVDANGPLVGAIESVDLDGGNRTVWVDGSTYPNGVTIDYENNFLYWTEYRTGKIGWMNMNTKEQGIYFVTSSNALLESLSYLSGNLYLIDHLQKFVQRVSVKDVMNDVAGSSAVQPYGPKVFFRLKGIRTFSSDNHEFDKNICTANRGGCPQICFPTASYTPRCICGDNYVYESSNNSCIQTHPDGDVTPPSFGSSCPSGTVFLTVDECSDTATYRLVQPNATDDSGKVSVKSLFKIQPTYQIAPSRPRIFHFTATDLSGNTAFCNYIVFSTAVTCPSFDSVSIPTGSIRTTPSCGNLYGSKLNVSCPGADHIVFEYMCDITKDWVTYSDISCPFVQTTTTVNSPTTTTSTTYKTKTYPPITSPSLSISNTTIVHRRSSKKLSGALIAFIVIVVLFLVGVIIFAIVKYRHRLNMPGMYFWRRGDDTIQLTDTSLFLHPGNTTENIYT